MLGIIPKAHCITLKIAFSTRFFLFHFKFLFSQSRIERNWCCRARERNLHFYWLFQRHWFSFYLLFLFCIETVECRKTKTFSFRRYLACSSIRFSHFQTTTLALIKFIAHQRLDFRSNNRFSVGNSARIQHHSQNSLCSVYRECFHTTLKIINNMHDNGRSSVRKYPHFFTCYRVDQK